MPLVAAFFALLCPLPSSIPAAETAPPANPTPPVTVAAPPANDPPVTPPTAAEQPPAADPDAARAALYVEQSYNYASIEGSGQRSRDVIQKIYMTREKIAIHDTAESVLIDLKNRTVTAVHHDKKTYRKETFENIKKRIDERIALQRRNLDSMVPGPQKEQVYETVKGFLDDEVEYTSDVKEMVEKSSSGAFLDAVTIVARRTHNGKTTKDTVLTAKLSRELQLPFKNFNYAEVLYYLELASEKMTRELTGPRAGLLPVELKLVLPTGGSVHSKVVKFEYGAGFDDKFFAPPEGYQDVKKLPAETPPQPPKINWKDLEE